MSSDTSIEVYLTLGIANSSKTLVSGACCLFSKNLQSLCFYLTERNESSASCVINIMPWERIQQQTRHTRFPGAPGPSKTPGTPLALTYSLNKYRNSDWAEVVKVTVVLPLNALGLCNHRLPSHLLATAFIFFGQCYT